MLLIGRFKVKIFWAMLSLSIGELFYILSLCNTFYSHVNNKFYNKFN